MTRSTDCRLDNSSVACAVAVVAVVILRLLLLVNVFRFFGSFVSNNSVTVKKNYTSRNFCRIRFFYNIILFVIRAKAASLWNSRPNVLKVEKFSTQDNSLMRDDVKSFSCNV